MPEHGFVGFLHALVFKVAIRRIDCDHDVAAAVDPDELAVNPLRRELPWQTALGNPPLIAVSDAAGICWG